MSVPAGGLHAPLFERGFRFRFVLRLCLAFAAGAAVLYGILYFVLSRPLTGDYAGVFHALRNLSVFLRPVIATAVLVYVLLVCGATGALCVYGLHKVAGPLYRMERVMEEFRAGTPTRTVSFRAGDQVEPLAQAFNAWIGKLRQERQRWAAAMEDAERVSLQDEAIRRTRMEEALREIEADLSRYR
jgi:HAMP domain-containing protein